MNNVLIVSHLAATWFMVGLIWIIQLVHYPLWCYVRADSSSPFHQQHSLRIGWLIAILGGAEAILAVALAIVYPTWLTVGGVIILAAIWVVTAIVQVPQHRALSSNWNPVLLRRLVTGNRIRTSLWTVRGIVAIGLSFTQPQLL